MMEHDMSNEHPISAEDNLYEEEGDQYRCVVPNRICSAVQVAAIANDWPDPEKFQQEPSSQFCQSGNITSIAYFSPPAAASPKKVSKVSKRKHETKEMNTTTEKKVRRDSPLQNAQGKKKEEHKAKKGKAGDKQDALAAAAYAAMSDPDSIRGLAEVVYERLPLETSGGTAKQFGAAVVNSFFRGQHASSNDEPACSNHFSLSPARSFFNDEDGFGLDGVEEFELDDGHSQFHFDINGTNIGLDGLDHNCP